MQINLIIGLGAGLVSAMLFASASTGTVLGLFVLFFLSPMPIAIAGLGWGWKAAGVAAVAGATAIGIVSAPKGAMFHMLALGAPTAVLSYLALLNREVETEAGTIATQWYPLGRIVAIAALIAGGLATLALLSTATDMDNLRAQLRRTIELMSSRPAGMPMPTGAPASFTPEQVTGLTNIVIGLFTASLASMWLFIAMLNMWLAGRVVRKSDRLVRPWPDLSQLHLPQAMPIALAVALAGTFLPDFAGLIAAGFASSILMAYVFVGLAILHNLTRGHAQRSIILSGTYAVLMVFGMIAGPALALLALAEPFSPLRRKPPPQGPAAN
ncbi:MAG: DUF2232 domain-containing protein [Hyphomicrobiaceae bacterium]